MRGVAAAAAFGMTAYYRELISCPTYEPSHALNTFVCEVTGNYTNVPAYYKLIGDERLDNGIRRIVIMVKDCGRDSETVEEAADCVAMKQWAYRKINDRRDDAPADEQPYQYSPADEDLPLKDTAQPSGLVTRPHQCCKPTQECFDYIKAHKDYSDGDDCPRRVCCWLDFGSSCPEPPEKNDIDLQRPPSCTGPEII